MSGQKKWRARILYENHRDEQGPSFGLHELLCVMVDDQLNNTTRSAKRYINGMPRNGVDKLLRDCSERVEKVFADLPVTARFAIVDGDKIASKLDLPASASLRQIHQALLAKYPAVQMLVPDAITPAQSNTEGLLQVIADCLSLPADDTQLQLALQKGRHALNSRDKIFQRAVRIEQRSARECFRQAQPALAKLVDALAELVRPAMVSE